ncbi:DEAD/DEAH box helicase [Zoogloea sp.]|uniref:DEAD/DEAH box helicase n=1 Tax=Zoogloea sp. TaxID=49181 RepID=UPI002BE131B8|nr:DEAD/DEAH box helicase [Zoogloea sp.]HNH18120.1 DEAD/DEAH box helicase [Zoogloea sp.]
MMQCTQAQASAALAGAGVISLRDYQEGLVMEIRDSLKAGRRRVLAYLPTGGGKTRVATAITQMTLSKSKGRVVVLANRKQLVHQFAAALRAAGLDVGVLQGENTHGLHRRVIVASVDTVHARGCIFDDMALFIIDEAHACAGSEKYRTLLFRYSRVPCIGLSATPFARGLGKPYPELADRLLFEDLIVGATVQSLVDAGHLTDLEIYAPSSPDMTGAKTSRTAEGEQDYRQADIEEAADRPELVGDILRHWFKLAGGVKTICFASSIAHSQHIVEQFRAAGVSAEHLDCYMDDETRADILGRFERGDFTVLSNVSLLSEGFDVPDTSCMILARPTKSLTRFLQMVGRVLRPAPGKTRALLLDHSGSVERIGHPFDDLPLELDDGNANKAGSRKEERKKSEPKPCPSCKFVRPAGVHECPKCGFAPQRQSDVEVADGELVKIDRKARKPATPDVKQHVYSQLLHVARHRGYKPGWAANQYRARFGVWPRGLRDVEAAPSAELLGWLKSQAIRFAKAREKAQEGRQHG